MSQLFVGSIYPRFLVDYLLNCGYGVDFAANNYQSALLEGLAHFDETIDIVSSPPLRKPYKCDDKMIAGGRFSSSEAGFPNFIYVGSSKCHNVICRMIFELVRVKRAIKSIITGTKDKRVVYCYSLHSPFLLAILSLKQRLGKVCVVIPDLPEFMSDNQGILRTVAKIIDRRLINYCVKRMDCFVLLSEKMKDRLPIKQKPYVVVEGIYRPKNLPIVEKNEKKIILYTGQLQQRYGLFDLVKAFMLIPYQNYELWLCGSCNLEEQGWFEEKAQEDCRILLKGRVTYEEVLVMQKQATLLVNPRHSNEEYTKYSFPSKTMEYLASGTPTLMCRLPSLPKEYYEHLFFFYDESIVGMKNKIIEVCQMDKETLNQKGERAAAFIRATKNPECQVGKITGMIHFLQSNHQPYK